MLGFIIGMLFTFAGGCYIGMMSKAIAPKHSKLAFRVGFWSFVLPVAAGLMGLAGWI